MLIKKQRGMTLLEVLVSMLIVAVGLVTTTMMLQVSNRYGYSAEYRARAMHEMQSLIEMVQANALGIDGYIFGIAKYQENGYSINIGTAEFKADTCSGEKFKDKDVDKEACELRNKAGKNAVKQAHTEMTNWLQRVQAVVPNGQAAVTRDEDKTGIYTVTIMWRIFEADQRAEGSATSNKTDQVSVDFTL